MSSPAPEPFAPLRRARATLHIEAAAIERVAARLDDAFERAVELIFASAGHVVTLGMGKSGIVARKISATLASVGTPSFFLHPAEAVHGDFGRVTRDDVLLALSYSGETEELLRLLPLIERTGAPLVSIVGRPDSTLARASAVVLDAGVDAEACPLGLAPTASTTAAMALGDALAMTLLERRGFQAEDFASLHPGGQIGRNLLRVQDLMHDGDRIPRVAPETPMSEAILEMSRKGFGITTVVDRDNRLLGVISDGDLRRLMESEHENALKVSAAAAMHAHHPRNPKPCTVTRRELATHALHVMETHRITALVVVDETYCVEGLLHAHDLWRVYAPNEPLHKA
jgi:arabinose-5-phosphate isomerase